MQIWLVYEMENEMFTPEIPKFWVSYIFSFALVSKKKVSYSPFRL